MAASQVLVRSGSIRDWPHRRSATDLVLVTLQCLYVSGSRVTIKGVQGLEQSGETWRDGSQRRGKEAEQLHRSTRSLVTSQDFNCAWGTVPLLRCRIPGPHHYVTWLFCCCCGLSALLLVNGAAIFVKNGWIYEML